MDVNLCIGLLHPPVGMALFVVARIADVPLEKGGVGSLTMWALFSSCCFCSSFFRRSLVFNLVYGVRRPAPTSHGGARRQLEMVDGWSARPPYLSWYRH